MAEDIKIATKKIFYKNSLRIQLVVTPNYYFVKEIKEISGCYWSKNLKSWNFPYRENYLAFLKDKFKMEIEDLSDNKIKNAIIIIDKKNGKIQLNLNDDSFIKLELKKIKNNFRVTDYPKWFFTGTNDNYLAIKKILKENNYKFRIEYKKDIEEKQDIPIIKHYVQTLLMRNYSKRTIDVYVYFFKMFVADFSGKDINILKFEELNKYVQDKIKQNNYKTEQQKQFISAIKFYYEKILGREKIFFLLGKNNTQLLKYNHKINIIEIFNIVKSSEKSEHIILLLLYYFWGFSFEKISQISLKDTKKLLHIFIKKHPDFKQLITKQFSDYYLKFKPKKYLFETKNNKQLLPNQIEKLFLKIFSNGKYIDIYKIEYKNICKLAELANNSANNYTSYFITFLKDFNFVHPLSIQNEEIRKFVIKLNKENYSKNTVNQYINSIKVYYEKAYHRKIDDEIFRPRRPKPLPEILSLNETFTLFYNISNIKHYCILAITYSGGLRRSETLNLKINDIDFERNEIRIKGGKGNKDRITLLSDNLKLFLLDYIKEYKPKNYLFEGATGGKYSVSSMSSILKKALKKSKITKKVTLHTLRHSFATHLLEQGTDLRYIQSILGHNSIKTTTIYTKVSNNKIKKIKSPFDNLNNNSSPKPP